MPLLQVGYAAAVALSFPGVVSAFTDVDQAVLRGDKQRVCDTST